MSPEQDSSVDRTKHTGPGSIHLGISSLYTFHIWDKICCPIYMISLQSKLMKNFYHLKYLESKLPEFISSTWWLWVRHWRHQTRISTKHYIPKKKLFFLMTSSWWSYLDVATKEEFSGNIQIAILDPHQAWLLHWLYGSNYLQWNGSYTIMNIRSRRNLMDKLVVHPSMSDLKLVRLVF